jgi:flagellar motor switch protein FliN/FliY
MVQELSRILRLEVPIVVQIGRRSMSLETVTALAPGAIVELPKSSEEELELLVNNKAIGSGIAVKVGENFGIKISYIGDLKSRIAALAAAPATPAPEMNDAAAEAMLQGQ